MGSRWVGGNRFHLLENGEAFFPRVFESIAAAQREVVLETFIWFDDSIGRQLHAVLIEAAKRGVQVDVTIDGFGSPDLSGDFLQALCAAGVRVHVYDPARRLIGWRVNWLRRMHRKIVVIDGVQAFVGGINYSADHVADFGPQAKQDYAVEIAGPLVADIHRFAHAQLAAGHRYERGTRRWFRGRGRVRQEARTRLPDAGPALAMFVTRDNGRHQNDIERHYRIAIRAARQRIVIANAYFFPGFRLVRQLRRAARRGVDVRLILQGEPDMPIVKVAASMLYHYLLRAGVRIYEYCERPLHGKVALTDDEWATVGSSNLDPLSLSLNLEANVVIRDREFNAELAQRLDALMRDSCKRIEAQHLEPVGWWVLARSFAISFLIRHYPSWASLLPSRRPRLAPAVHDAGDMRAACPVGAAEN